jgi:hypothetical protein
MPLDLEQMKLSGFEPDPDLKWEKIGNVPAPGGVDVDSYDAIVSSVAIDEHRILVIDHTLWTHIIHESYVREFDTRTREWSNEEWPSLNQPRNAFSCVLCNGKVYVIGGNDSHDECLNSIECFDLSASPRQWITMDQGLQTARHKCRCVARGTQVYIIGGYGNRNQLTSVEILKTETGQLVAGPDMPQHKTFAAAAVNNELLVFAQQKPVEGDGYVGKIHTLRQGRLNSTWEMTSFSLQSKTLVSQPIVIGDCVLLSRYSVYNTRRACWWDLPTNSSLSMFYGALVGEAEIIAFDKSGIYSLKLKRSVEPLTSTIPRPWCSSPCFSHPTFVMLFLYAPMELKSQHIEIYLQQRIPTSELTLVDLGQSSTRMDDGKLKIRRMLSRPCYHSCTPEMLPEALLIQHYFSYWELFMSFNLMMILSESVKQSVLIISTSRMSRTFFFQQRCMALHFCSTLVSSTSASISPNLDPTLILLKISSRPTGSSGAISFSLRARVRSGKEAMMSKGMMINRLAFLLIHVDNLMS